MNYSFRIKTSKSVVLLLLLCSFFTQNIYAWDGHFLLTYAALENSDKISKEPGIRAETLTEFLNKERRRLITILAQNEKWSQQNLANYPALPPHLYFSGTDQTISIQAQFLKAMRINPQMNFPLFIQYPPNQPHRISRNPIKVEKVLDPALVNKSNIQFPGLPLEGILSGELLSAFEIVTTASDEPDYGMDLDLWEDNNSWFGAIYGFGKQPFGNKTVIFSSQVPFHMGFYYESNIIYKFAPSLKRTFPEYRIHQYLNLSQFAFSTGHYYWGYRFLGWALHYAQDLNQPYHSTVSPNTSTAKLIYVDALKIIGIQSPEQKLVQLLTNRHSSLENYVYYYMKDVFKKNDKNNVTIQAISDSNHDKKYPNYTDSYPRDIIAKESNLLKNSTDERIKTVFPSKYVSDPNYIYYKTETFVNIFKIVEQSENLDSLNEILNELLRNLGSHTRNIITYATYPRAQI